MKSKQTLTIIALSIAMLGLAGCNKEKKDDVDLSMLDNVSKDKPAQAKADTQTAQSESKPSIEQKQRVESYPRNEFSVSRQVAIQEIEKGNPYTSSVSEVEGFRSKPYSDVGQGFSVGNGWNMSFQSPKSNHDWASQAGIAEPMIKNIVAVSGHMQGAVPSGIDITPAQATSVAMAMKPTFEQPAIKLFGASTWNKLKDNQKAVLVYHIEKVGPGGAAKYKGLIKSVQTYANSPTEANGQEVVSHITYGYKIKYPDGSFKQMEDHRSQLFMGALFLDPQQYRYLLGKAAAPTAFTGTAKAAGFSIDTTKPADAQVQAQDDFNKALDQIADSGNQPVATPELDGKALTYVMDTPDQGTQGNCPSGQVQRTLRVSSAQTVNICEKPKSSTPVAPVKAAVMPTPTAPVASVAQPQEPHIQGNCPSGAFQKTHKMPDGSNILYCAIGQ